MSHADNAKRFTDLHVKGNPVLLYNAWDAGSAKAIRQAGAKAIATSSWSMSEAHGYRDGETMPLDLVERIVARIVATSDVPVTMDFESGYLKQSSSPHPTGDSDTLAWNIARLIDVGIAGVNFEDRHTDGSSTLYAIEHQARRIAVLRRVAEEKGVPLFINARTDLFLGMGGEPADAIDEALQRAEAYAAAGASGFFIPGLTDADLIAKICARTRLPVNVMVMGGVPSNARLTELGVARISYGPIPYLEVLKALEAGAKSAIAPGT